jgi:uncharacterized protein DUF6644
MNLLPLFQQLEASSIGEAIRGSLWMFPVIEAFHLMAFAALGGTILLVDLNLVGIVLKGRPTDEIARAALPWFLGSLLVMLATGVLLFLSESVKCYYSVPFWIKMASLLLALVFTFTVRRRVAAAHHTTGEWRRVLAGIVSMIFWAGVAWGGRWIGFSG